MKIGLYGGTFSPVHLGHVRAAEAFIALEKPDLFIVMPAGVPPHKNCEVLDGKVRFEMCKAAFSELDGNVSVSDFELLKEGKSYTYETVMHLKEIYPDADIYVLCGEDMALTLDKWYRAEELLTMCAFRVVPRGNDRERLLEKVNSLKTRFGADVDLIDIEPLEISSTEIRDMISSGEDENMPLPEKVLEIINEKQLYRS